MLTAHQAIEIRRAIPEAVVDGDMIHVGIWRMQLVHGQLTLPSARRLDDPFIDFSDEAAEVWFRVREVLGCV